MSLVAIKLKSLSCDQENDFSNSSMKSYDDFLNQSSLSNLIGVSAKVVSALQNRIGHGSLSADSIADDLHVSKRTLQRHLLQQNEGFTELRDRVRFHFVLPLLVENELSIDRLSAMLDFTDRTSFTLAFKRWTGLSPNTFRKLFRDYS
jgi:AraC-like DNA-binding protein